MARLKRLTVKTKAGIYFEFKSDKYEWFSTEWGIYAHALDDSLYVSFMTDSIYMYGENISAEELE